jgi:hypothetical protein
VVREVDDAAEIDEDCVDVIEHEVVREHGTGRVVRHETTARRVGGPLVR